MSTPAAKRSRADENGDAASKDDEIAALRRQLAALQTRVTALTDAGTTYYASATATHAVAIGAGGATLPATGLPARHVRELIVQNQLLDFDPRLNTSSYVNVVQEPEEAAVALRGLAINIADASVYPASVKLHDETVNMIAQLWHAPAPADGSGNYCGAGTVGSTEACLLAGLALKFRWRRWYAARKGLSKAEVEGIKCNVVISTMYQAAWEKFFRYFDIQPIFVKPNVLETQSAANPAALVAAANEKTIGIIGILGNHYNGVYDHVWEIDAEVTKANAAHGWQLGIHVDAASGGFIAPFQEKDIPPFDFRLPNVLTMSASGHKFGESCCGTGWVVFRQREDLAEHIAVSVSYLGGHCDSMTLNFSRPASGPYVQFYKFLRLGREGYTAKVKNQMEVAAYMRDHMRSKKHTCGKPRFEILDGGLHEHGCLPVVGARLNKACHLHYDDIDLQHALAESHWYVSGYELTFENYDHDAIKETLFTDVDMTDTMFRIVVKSNLTLGMAQQLMGQLDEVIQVLDDMKDGYESVHRMRLKAKTANHIEVWKAKVKVSNNVHTSC